MNRDEMSGNLDGVVAILALLGFILIESNHFKTGALCEALIALISIWRLR